MEIDFSKLRRDLMNYFGSAMTTGFCPATEELKNVERASNNELVVIAEKYGFDISDYEEYER